MAAQTGGVALRLCALVFLLGVAFCKGFVEDLDESFKDGRKDDIWLVDFYAPWCGHCKKLEPVWNEVGVEMKSIGSPVKVGKMDATSYSTSRRCFMRCGEKEIYLESTGILCIPQLKRDIGIASEFGVRGYPTIKLLKGDLAYNYRGPRTKDDIIEFAHRVSGALIRPLPSQQMFEHVQRRHRVFFVYIGGESPLKEKYIDAASELIVYTYFFSASEDVVPEYVTLREMPAVLVFKDGTHFIYDEYEDGDLSSWISRERFQSYLTVDGFLLYELGDTGKLVAIAVIDEKNTSVEHTRLKSVIQEVARDYRDQFHRWIRAEGNYSVSHFHTNCLDLRDFQFGHMDGNEYINSLLMDEVKVPTVVVLNTSNQQYFLLDRQIENTEDMVRFFHGVLDGAVEAQGGDSILQRLKRMVFDAKSTIVSIFKSSPIMGCFLFGLPLGVISIMCYGIYTADTDGGYIEERYEVSRSELEGGDAAAESGEQQEPRGGHSPGPAGRGPKDVLEKKTD